MNPIEIAVWLLLLALSLVNGAVESVSWTPTPIPAETGAETAPVASGEALTWQQVHDMALAVSGSPGWAVKAATVAMCESSGQWWQRWADNGTSHGLFSVQPRWWGTVPDDAWAQVEQTWAIWLSQRGDARGPWWPWTCAAGGIGGARDALVAPPAGLRASPQHKRASITGVAYA